MANKCVAPKCEDNYNELKKGNKKDKKYCRSSPRKRDEYYFPTELLLRKKCSAKKEMVIHEEFSSVCDKHFLLWAYGVVDSMFDFHSRDRGSNPGRGGKIS